MKSEAKAQRSFVYGVVWTNQKNEQQQATANDE